MYIICASIYIYICVDNGYNFMNQFTPRWSSGEWHRMVLRMHRVGGGPVTSMGFHGSGIFFRGCQWDSWDISMRNGRYTLPHIYWRYAAIAELLANVSGFCANPCPENPDTELCWIIGRIFNLQTSPSWFQTSQVTHTHIYIYIYVYIYIYKSKWIKT